ncbi:MAG: diaminopimelate decarboxylase [Oscillospiraceae bacterium]|nr:diaminopimelate decarboxylase [Oscillospiraceae bacterium]
MNKLNNFSTIRAADFSAAAERFATPVYVYDENLILTKCRECLDMPHAFGLIVRYAMKANSNRTLLQTITGAGLHIDASSLNEVLRASLAGVPYDKIMLTTQEAYTPAELDKLQDLLLRGLKYNVCSLRQLRDIAGFAAAHELELSIRVQPGIGSGESATRTTGDSYSCFGIHLSDLPEAAEYTSSQGIEFRKVHCHIGSGSNPNVWIQSIDVMLDIIARHFPRAECVSFGGGFKVARMPDEKPADLRLLGDYAKERIENFYQTTGRKLKVEIEPGTYIVANAGYAVARVIDKKSTGDFNFIITDGGMEINARPIMYGSRHPFYIMAGDTLKSSEFGDDPGEYEAIIAGKCCESSDMQTLTDDGYGYPVKMKEPDIGDLCVIGGVGAYCSAMTPFNYNSHTQIPEALFTAGGELRLIRRRQTLEQIVENEM